MVAFVVRFLLLLSLPLASAPFSVFKTKLPDRRPDSLTTRHDLQSDEFRLEWDEVWKAYFRDEEDEFDDFMRWFLERGACKRPKRVAIESSSNMLVCARPCDEGFYSVLLVSEKTGRRVRTCKKAVAPPPVSPTRNVYA